MKPRPQTPKGWPAQAVKVGELLPVERWHPAVVTGIAHVRKTERWCVAISGGADSLALLMLVWAQFPERRDRLVALHFNHRLRGRAADADERFCRDVCRSLAVRLRVGQWRQAPSGASEAEARQARHEFFRKEMRQVHSRTLWLAHQQDDIAETMLMRLARGSGTAGLAAPRPVQTVPGRVRYLRPLLSVTKSELVTALTEAKVKWREDASNAGNAFLRNRLRHEVLPVWQAVARERQVLGGVALARERLEEDDVALERWVEQTTALQGKQLWLLKLAGAPRAVWRRALHRWLLRVRPDTDLSRQGFAQLLLAAERGENTRFSLGATAFAVIKQEKLSLQRRPGIPI